MEIKQRSTSHASFEYKKAKKILEKKAEKGHCIICGAKLEGKRRKYCKEECWVEFYSQFNTSFTWARVRQMAIERDEHRCVKCGKKEYEKNESNEYIYLIADHITAIALGGDEFDLNNIQILCQDCNRIKTSEDLKKIAILRRQIKGEKQKEEELEEGIKNQKKWERLIEKPDLKEII